jgi:hypothetical protein
MALPLYYTKNDRNKGKIYEKTIPVIMIILILITAMLMVQPGKPTSK